MIAELVEDLVPVASEVFDDVLGDRPNQVERLRDDVEVTADELLAVEATPGDVTEDGLRTNVSVGIQYIESWLRGVGAAALYNLMEDAATAEISRSQVWQWIRHGRFEREHVREVVEEEVADFEGGRFAEARELFEQVALGDDLVEFLTVPAYEHID